MSAYLKTPLVGLCILANRVHRHIVARGRDYLRARILQGERARGGRLPHRATAVVFALSIGRKDEEMAIKSHRRWAA
eukprot:4841119-Pyramimonas_sp.AAC.1